MRGRDVLGSLGRETPVRSAGTHRACAVSISGGRAPPRSTRNAWPAAQVLGVRITSLPGETARMRAGARGRRPMQPSWPLPVGGGRSAEHHRRPNEPPQRICPREARRCGTVSPWHRSHTPSKGLFPIGGEHEPAAPPSSRAPADGMRLADRPSTAPAKASAVPVGHRVMRRPLPRVGPALTAPTELQVTWEESQRGTGTTVAKPTHSGRIKSML